MSYQYPSNYIEHYSPSPTASSTPHALNPAQWDTTNPPALQDPNDQVQHQQQQHQHVLHSPIALNTSSAPSVYQHQHMSSEHSTPIQAPVYEPPTVIQLQERPPRRSALQRKADRDASAITTKTRSSHHAKQISPLSLHAPSPLSYERHEQVHSPTSQNERVNESELASMPIRHQRTTSRAQVRFSTSHPYSPPDRPIAGSSTSSGNPVTASSLLGHYQQKLSSPYATLAYPTTTDKDKPSPALSAASSSPLLTVSAIPPLESTYIPAQRIREGRYVVRVDMYYSKTTKMLTAFLELPGIKKSAINVKLVRRSGVKHIEVFGKSQLFSGNDIRQLNENDSDGSDGDTRDMGREGDSDEGFYIMRERKHGEFRRVLIVPEDTTPDRVSITFEDGLLVIKIPCERQTTSEAEQEVSEIPVK